jgi:hypothetical protein
LIVPADFDAAFIKQLAATKATGEQQEGRRFHRAWEMDGDTFLLERNLVKLRFSVQ